MYKIIASGSTGNAELYFNSILVDIGVPWTSIKPFYKDIQLVTISHVHTDHFNLKTLHKLAYERPTLRIGVGEWMLPYLDGFKNVDVYEFGKWYDYGSFKISIGKCYHDTPNCFYRLEKNGYKIFRATDTFTLEGITAQGYNLFCIEHNFDADTIWDRIKEKESRGEFAYERGAINSHLSEQAARDFFFKNKGPESILIRLHETKSLL